ncbi:hypothetical protein [Gryllotalpicola protaetiae]|uniref:Uncharacterized protein n=1 Tax=Gryllotalpicola protaetiae TaxID=2419771 RepID=A0A387BP95_9MICO|nr:hypothetical protein [Gryllotalpicola protaetiae]AYG02776.1 hypothetical protein D7I44_04075 [Gryllotalpicola protaetiae]
MYVAEFAGRSSSKLSNSFRPYDEQLRRELGLLDGEKRFAYLLYFVPDDAGWPDAPGFKLSKYDQEYMQSAGNAEAMTIEVRRLEDDGEFHQYAIGRPGGAADAGTVEIHYAENTLSVPRSEVFTADQAAPIYYKYFQSHAVPDGVVLRELDLT